MGTKTITRLWTSNHPSTGGEISQKSSSSSMPSWLNVTSMPLLSGTCVAWSRGSVWTTRIGLFVWKAQDASIWEVLASLTIEKR